MRHGSAFYIAYHIGYSLVGSSTRVSLHVSSVSLAVGHSVPLGVIACRHVPGIDDFTTLHNLF